MPSEWILRRSTTRRIGRSGERSEVKDRARSEGAPATWYRRDSWSARSTLHAVRSAVRAHEDQILRRARGAVLT